MWLIMFTPYGSNNFIPQLLCYSEQEASEWLRNVSMSMVGHYSYCFVPVNSISLFWQKREPWQCLNEGTSNIITVY